MNRQKVALGEIVRRIVRENIRIKQGEAVKIICGSHNIDLADKIAAEIRLVDGFPMIQADPLDYKIEIAKSGSLQYFYRNKKCISLINKQINAFIFLNTTSDPEQLNKIPDELDRLIVRLSNLDWRSAWLAKKLIVEFPSKEKAHIASMSYNDLCALTFNSIKIKQPQITNAYRKIISFIDKGTEVSVKCKNGTNLKFNYNGAHYLDSGVVTDNHDERFSRYATLPGGILHFAVDINTVNGSVLLDKFTIKGQKISGIKLVFEEGKLIEHSAKSGSRLLDNMLERIAQKFRIISGFSIGLNPEMKIMTGISKLDQNNYGALNLTLGYDIKHSFADVSDTFFKLRLDEPDLKFGDNRIIRNGVMEL